MLLYFYYICKKYKYGNSKIKEIDSTPTVYSDKELQDLCALLQQSEQHKAPKDSNFFREYIVPASQQPSDETRENRDQRLVKLLTAAHIAFGMDLPDW